jgi:hypothetical protein
MTDPSALLDFLSTKLSPADFAKVSGMLNEADPSLAQDDPPPFAGSPSTGAKPGYTKLTTGNQTAMDTRTLNAVRAVNELHAAEEAVRPYVGNIIGMDSAVGVYRAALKALGHDPSGISPGAMQATFNAIKGTRAKRNVAMDAKERAGFEERFPDAGRLSRR